MKLGMKMMDKGCRDRDRATYTTAYSLVMPDNMHFARSHPPVACNKINYSSLRVEILLSLSHVYVRSLDFVPFTFAEYRYQESNMDYQTTKVKFVCLLYMVMLILNVD